MPLCNNLDDLIARDNVGYCIYGVVLACIIFNILILLLRSCKMQCEYYSTRKALRDELVNLSLMDKEEIPFDEPEKPENASIQVELPLDPLYFPQTRDFHTFGMRQSV